MKNNRLLVEYLGLKFYIHAQTGEVIKGTAYAGSQEFKWQPDKSWDDLMEVVNKIMRDYNNPIKFQLYSKGGPIIGASFKQFDGAYICKETEDPINSVYNACVTYIEQKS